MQPNQIDLSGKVAIVTGSAQGIGEATVGILAACGAKVVVSDIQAEAGESVAAALGGDAIFVPCDISDYEQVQLLMNTAVKRFGKVDIMVNNAGYHVGGPKNRVAVDEYPLEAWRKIIDVNLTGTFYCCQIAAQQMKKQGFGCIINIASVAGVVALRLQIGHVAAKAGIIRMTEAMACELGAAGIRVNCISPGSTLTEGTRGLFYDDKEKAAHMMSFVPSGRPGECVDIGHAVAFLASDQAGYINGHNLIVDGGWTCGFNRDF
jgi:3-oxoacyl-[acyl-carrier protein] reductase